MPRTPAIEIATVQLSANRLMNIENIVIITSLIFHLFFRFYLFLLTTFHVCCMCIVSMFISLMLSSVTCVYWMHFLSIIIIKQWKHQTCAVITRFRSEEKQWKKAFHRIFDIRIASQMFSLSVSVCAFVLCVCVASSSLEWKAWKWLVHIYYDVVAKYREITYFKLFLLSQSPYSILF